MSVTELIGSFLNSTSDYTGLTDEWNEWDQFGNITTPFPLPVKELWREIPLGIVLTFLCMLTSVGNAMVLHAVRTERRLQSVSKIKSKVSSYFYKEVNKLIFLRGIKNDNVRETLI